MDRTRNWARDGAACALLIVPVAALGIVFLVAMYVAFGLGERDIGHWLGMTNDVLVAAYHLLMIPVALAIHA